MYFLLKILKQNNKSINFDDIFTKNNGFIVAHCGFA